MSVRACVRACLVFAMRKKKKKRTHSCGSERAGIVPYLRRAVQETEEHEELVRLAETRGDDAQGVHEWDSDQDLPTADRVRHGSPGVRARHHPDEDDRVEPSLRLGVELQVTLRTRQDEGHGYHVHLLAGADEAAHGEQEVVKLAIFCEKERNAVISRNARSTGTVSSPFSPEGETHR